MRTFCAIAGTGRGYKSRALSGIARVHTMRAAARLPRYLISQLHTVCLAVFGAALAFAAAGAHADSITIGGTGTGLGAIKWMVQEFNKSRPDAQLIVAPSLGSSGAIKAVLAGAVDVGISSRPITAEESSRGASARAYARTPFVVATAAKNKATGLTLRKLAQIYSGEVSRWPDGSPIRLVVRPESDADTVALKALSAGMNNAVSAAMARPGLRLADTDQDNADALEQLPGSLGTTTLTLIVTEHRALKPLALDGVAPTLQSLAAGRYRYIRILYLVTGRDPSPLAKEFAAFIRSPAGQAVLARSGNLALQE